MVADVGAAQPAASTISARVRGVRMRSNCSPKTKPPARRPAAGGTATRGRLVAAEGVAVVVDDLDGLGVRRRVHHQAALVLPGDAAVVVAVGARAVAGQPAGTADVGVAGVAGV